MFVPVVILFIERNDKILLLRRGNLIFGAGKYSIPGGKVEAGESARSAAVREAYEELGIKIQEDNLSLVHVINRNGEKNEEIFALVFKVNAWSGEPFNKEPEKHSDIQWFALSALPENMLPAHKQALEMIVRNKNYSEHGW